MSIKHEIDSAIMLITHDLGVVAGLADRVMVMYAGRQVELGQADEVFYETRHPYTLGLLASLPRLDDVGDEALVPIRGAAPVVDQQAHRVCVPSAVPVHAPRALPGGGARAAARGRLRPPVRVPLRRGAGGCGRRGLPPSARRSKERKPRWCRDRRAAEPTRHRPAGETLLVASDLVKDFPVRGGVFGRSVARVSAVAGVSLSREAGRDTGPGGRVRLRQVHHGSPAAQPDPAHVGVGGVRRPGDLFAVRSARSSRCVSGSRSSSKTRTRP